MLTQVEIAALKERVSTGDVWLNTGKGTCLHVGGIGNTGDNTPGSDGTLASDSALLAGGGVMSLADLSMGSFVVLRPCLATAGRQDNLAILQKAERDGLVVDYLKGDVSLPMHLLPPR
jgi:hypothetical protein